MILDSSVDRFNTAVIYLFFIGYNLNIRFSKLLETLQRKLHHCDGVWLRCKDAKGNNHLASLRLALHHHSSTLYPVQLRILG